jgi:membrane protein DedA with SNARE-associated domain
MSTVLHSLYLIPGQTAPWAGWAYILLAILVAVEGPVTTLAGALAASTGYLNPILVFVSAGVGNLIADTLWYSLGYMGKIEWLLHYGGKLGVKEVTLARLQKDIDTHIHKILFVAKLTLGFVVPTLIAAGLARVPMKRWFGVLFAGECLWTGGLVLIGYYFGYMIQRIETNLRWISIGGTVIIIGLVLYYIYHHRPKLEQES